ncbi:MAG: acyl-CoA dehydrogenase C-terminal domain-containing protein, partial [Actinobacteria bacterium]|nr:acyl-CoA dehydrogenase C-terminal domain-containing protein [Actinomycetota bacterium]
AGDYDAALAGASPFLRQFGTVIGGWLMARSAIAAKREPAEAEPSFLADKVNTARFYNEHLLPQANGLIATVKGGNDLLEQASF